MKRVSAYIIGSLLIALCAVVNADVAGIQKLAEEGKYDQALAQVDQELQNDPTNVTFRFLKGLVLTRAERLEQARDIFIDITSTNPDLPEPYNNLAVVYADLGDFDHAREALEQAINTHPAYATAHENIGDIYAKLASQAYNQALELDAENNTARAKLFLVNDLFSRPGTGSSVLLAGTSQDTAEQQACEAEAERQRQVAEQRAREAEAERQRELAEQQDRLAEAERQRQMAEQRALEAEAEQQARVAEAERQRHMAEQRALDAEAESQRQMAEQQARVAEAERQRQLAEQRAREAEAERQRQVIEQQAREQQEVIARQEVVKDIKQAVLNWSAAWSNQNIDVYLGYYARDFTPDDGRPLSQWRDLRRQRLNNPGKIRVNISDLVVDMLGSEHAQATFTQVYESDIYSDRVKKTLLMKLEDDNWRITQETTK